ncbi:MAG: SDR family oxidoreductase [Oxalobacteraceae bacterium]|jgi:NAD(P)-dependent dehydrogenase (short-subunit alcohol dehydrogenase family)|nr:SDR family oxidoreductase [Oxalobacteraceae bacterium]
MQSFAEKTAVITGAGSGLGREFALLGAKLGMRLVLADVQQDALKQTEASAMALGADVLSQVCDVRNGDQVESLAQRAVQRFGSIHLVFNNAGVGAGGLIWESTQHDWEWVLGVNVWGVVHGVRVFTPIMLASEKADPTFQGHIVNTASMAGLLTPPAMGVYNVSKHAVVALTETLYHDLSLIESGLGVSVLCPYFVPTGISQSENVRPSDTKPAEPATRSQQLSQAMLEKAVTAGKVSAAEVAQMTFDAIRARQFYIYSHPQALGNVDRRMQDILHARNPSDPYEQAPKLRDQWRAGLRED